MNAKLDSICEPIKSAFPVFAWTLLAWSWRGSDGPFLMGMIAVCAWSFFSHRQHPMPPLPRGLWLSCGLWFGLLILGELYRFWGQGLFGRAATVGLLEWASLLMFLPASLLLFRQQKHLLWLLLVPVLAVLARIVAHVSSDTWQSDLFGRGFNGFGLHHVPFGLQASLAILALLALGPAAVRTLPRYRPAAALALAASTLLITQALLRSGTRSGLICLAVAIAVLLWQQRASALRALGTAKGALSATLVLVALTAAISLNAQTLHQRFVVGAYLQADISFDLDTIPRDKDIFFGRRLHLSAFGLERWLDKPLLGHGTTGVAALLDTDPDFHIHHHLHNTYVQTLAEIGVLGALAWAMVSVLILIGVYRHGGRISCPALRRFFWSAALALAVWSLQSAPIHVAYWRFAVIMVCSLGLTIIWLGTHQANDRPPRARNGQQL